MPNEINLISRYLPVLDEKYQAESKSAILDIDPQFVRDTMEAKSVLIPKMTLSGLADYDRNGGYVGGSQKIEWQTHTFTMDRNRMFTVDTMDDIETAYIAYSMLAGEFIRLHVAPELDSYRFSKYADKAGTTRELAITPDNVLSALVDGRTSLTNKQVPLNDIVIFATPDLMGDLMMSKELTRFMGVDKVNVGTLELEVATFNRMPIVEVPSERMMTAYTFHDGTTTGQEAGGYVPTTNAQQVNFLMLARSAVKQIVKRAAPKVITPEANQSADGWKFGYRIYHDSFVLDNKADGIYANIAPRA